jgi:hypothetical protein
MSVMLLLQSASPHNRIEPRTAQLEFPRGQPSFCLGKWNWPKVGGAAVEFPPVTPRRFRFRNCHCQAISVVPKQPGVKEVLVPGSTPAGTRRTTPNPGLVEAKAFVPRRVLRMPSVRVPPRRPALGRPHPPGGCLGRTSLGRPSWGGCCRGFGSSPGEGGVSQGPGNELPQAQATARLRAAKFVSPQDRLITPSRRQ